MRFKLLLPILPLLAGCATVPQANKPSAPPPPARSPITQVVPPTQPNAPPVVGFRAPQVLRAPGLEAVIERDSDALTRQFGNPRLDVREGDMRKLQFSGEACVLDVFLYPLREGSEPVATWIEARRASDGQDVDRAACVAALRR
ncbi:MAG: hypothetical protein J7493_07220 [Porphyrobacter sp.]|nr:hypothetical protein [Porphyrobacter sp.]